jgi:3-hydroxyisobutyrate dehydrogenase
MADAQKIAVLGTGIMGAPIARNLARAGFDVRAWNRTRSKAEPLAGDGVTVADTANDAARGADFVLTMLGDGKAVESTMAGDAAHRGALAAMSNDSIWLQCATVGIEATDRLAELAQQSGVPFVDSPVLGTKKPAEDAKLSVLASGAPELEQRCRPVFEAIGQKVSWLGPVGTGTRLKLVMNSWVLAVTAGVAETLALAEGLGLDPELFLSTLSGAQMDTPYAHLKGEAILKGDFTASFPAAGAAKDSGLIVDAADSCGISADIAKAVHAKFERTVDEGHGGDDMAAAYLATIKH